jgi:hypothetical protein
MRQAFKKKPNIKTQPRKEQISPVDDIAAFLNRDHGSELSEFTETLNDGLGILVTIDDEETGIPLHLFVQGEDSDILKKKLEKLDKERFRSMRDLLEWVESFDILSRNIYEKFANYLTGRIESIQTNAQKHIETFDQTISKLKNTPLGSTKGGKETIKAFEEKKNRLKTFVSRLSKHKENVGKAKDTERLLDIEVELEEEVRAFDAKTKPKKKKSFAAFLIGLKASVPTIKAAMPKEEEREEEREEFDVFEELDIDPYVSPVDNDEDESSSSSDVEEELSL